MKRKVSFFAVLAMCAIFASNANANVASQGYVDDKFTDSDQGFAGTAANANYATNATNDSDGNKISDTYVKIGEISGMLTTDDLSGYASTGYVDDKFTDSDQDFAGTAANANYATSAGSANTATNATNDSDGNKISDTYATKTEINNLASQSSGTGAVVTGVSQTNGKVSVTMGDVRIPIGENGTTYAAIWVE